MAREYVFAVRRQRALPRRPPAILGATTIRRVRYGMMRLLILPLHILFCGAQSEGYSDRQPLKIRWWTIGNHRE